MGRCSGKNEKPPRGFKRVLGFSAPPIASPVPVTARSLFAPLLRPVPPSAPLTANCAAGSSRPSAGHRFGSAPAAPALPSPAADEAASSSTSLACNPHRFTPVVNYKVRGAIDLAPLHDAARGQMSAALQADVVSAGTVAGRASNMRTWALLHHRWFGRELPMLPLTPARLCAIAAQMKAAGYPELRSCRQRRASLAISVVG